MKKQPRPQWEYIKKDYEDSRIDKNEQIRLLLQWYGKHHSALIDEVHKVEKEEGSEIQSPEQIKAEYEQAKVKLWLNRIENETIQNELCFEEFIKKFRELAVGDINKLLSFERDVIINHGKSIGDMFAREIYIESENLLALIKNYI